MLFIDNKFSLMNAIHMAAHDYLPVYTEIISFDSSEKSLCARQKHPCLCDLIVHCSNSICRLNCRHAFVNLDSVLKCNVVLVVHI